ncbi:MAG: polyprenyl synthetase family protein [bacterium]|nr:polyprenyl synthetase family protein [bacterium]
MTPEGYLEAVKERLDPFLDGALPPAEAPPEALHGAMRHLLFPGGKRLRPGLLVASCEAFGGGRVQALPAAAAVELIHTYSLVHDDLPCMDDDDERRGRPSVHVAYGESTALLAGDALQAQAFAVLAAAQAPADVVLGATRDLACAAGSMQLVGGQVEDLAFATGGADEEARVESVHQRKSAALIAASVTMGARFGAAEEAWLDRLHKFGIEVGIAFQIADDLLDAEPNAEDGDEPCSLVRVLGSERASERAESLLNDALGRVAELGPMAEPLRMLARYAVRRNL